MIIRRFAFLVVCACAAFVIRCGPHPTGVATTGGSEVVGVLVKQGGVPVEGAVVHLDSATSDTSYKILDSGYTNSTGKFSIKHDLGNAFYSIYGDYHNKELVVLIRDVKDTDTSSLFHEVDVGTHTMYPPGFISGRVIIDEPSLTGTICYIPGTSFMAVTDDLGNFVISGVPADTYKVYFDFPNYVVGRDSGVIVKSGATTDVGTIVLFYDPNKPIPAPRSVAVTYDTLRGIMTVSWSSVHVSDLKGYVVSRSINGSVFTVLDTVATVDSMFHDTLDSVYLSYDTCRYEVAAFDSGTSISSSNPVWFVTVPPSLVRTVFTFQQVSGAVNDTAEACSTIVITASYFNINNQNKLITWYDAYPNSVLRQDSIDSKYGADTVRHAFSSSGRAVLYVSASDDHGNIWRDSIVLVVRPGHVDAVSCDSTAAGVTIRWNASRQSNFADYRLYRVKTGGDTLLYAATAIADTSHIVQFAKNGVFQYYVVVADSQGRVSPHGKSINAWIKNTAPQFTNDTTAIPKTASVGKQYLVQLAITDINGDSLSLKQLGTLGLTVSGTTVSWTPTILDTGTKHVSIQVNDGFGGLETLSWNVKVVPVGVCAWGDSMTTARFSLGATVLNGTLYAAGGAKFFNSGGKLVSIAVSAVEAYPLSSSGSWEKTASLASARYALGLAGYGSTLFSFGGTKDGVNHFSDVDSVSVTGTVWDTACALPVPFAGSAVCAIGNKTYCIGGITKVADSDVVSNAIYEFDASTGQCVLKNYMRTRRVFHQAAVLNGKIYIIGGLAGASSLNDCVAQASMEVFNPATNMSEPDTFGSLGTPRYYFGAAEANGKLYALGGCSSEQSAASLSSIEEYDPAFNIWSVKADMPAARSNFAAVSWQGAVYAVGGIIGGQATRSVVIYYP